MSEIIHSLPDISIIIPAYAEEKRIGNSLDYLANYLHTDSFAKSKNVEVFVVAAESSDSTESIVLERQHFFTDLRLLTPGPKVGKGRDVQYGMLHARGRYTIFMDADLATPLWHIKEFYDTCDEDSDIAIGTRNFHTYRSNRLRGAFATFGNKCWQLMSGIAVSDTQCGFKMFNQNAKEICFSRLTILGWDFDMEILAIAHKHKLKITPIPIDDWRHMPHSTYTDSMPQITLRMMKSFFRIIYNRLTGKY